MSAQPIPLPVGTIVADRFEIYNLLGRGGFGIVYRAKDLVRNTEVVVKELAPNGLLRRDDGTIPLDEQTEVSGHLQRQRFQQEAALLKRVRSIGIPTVRAIFADNGTAYVVTDYLAGSETLAKRLIRQGRVEVEVAREILLSLLDVLERVHHAKILHRDIKPSNVLLGPSGEVFLIDFGSAREYAITTQTVMFTPGYAPPEQLSERAPRGPATDLYGLAATIFHALVGEPPPTANDRLAGVPLPDIRSHRSDVDESLAHALTRCLALRMAERPQGVEELRSLLAEDMPSEPVLNLQALDELLVRARELKFDRRGCPACEGVLVDPRPLRRLGCPVCREGMIRLRDLDPHLCPICREGRLYEVANRQPLSICPSCTTGMLEFRRKTVLSKVRIATCPSCSHTYETEDDVWVRDDGITQTQEEWRGASGRSTRVRACDGCQAQFDLRSGDRWVQVVPKPTEEPYPLSQEEWARIAAGLEPSVGNAECDVCRSDYWLDQDRLTLVDHTRDPFEFAKEYLGRTLSLEDVRWVGVGKTSGQPGAVCERCGTEFDRTEGNLTLIQSPNRRLARRSGETQTLADWHRIAAGVPMLSEELIYAEQMAGYIREAYQSGALPFDSSSNVLWRSQATRDDGTEGTLTVTDTEITFGGRFRKWRLPRTEIEEVLNEEDTLILVHGEEETHFELAEIRLVAHLSSGNPSVSLTAQDLVARMCVNFPEDS